MDQEMNNDGSKIKSSKCDVCGNRGVGAYTAGGKFVCRDCDPDAFEATARQDIDAWLNGAEL